MHIYLARKAQEQNKDPVLPEIVLKNLNIDCYCYQS